MRGAYKTVILLCLHCVRPSTRSHTLITLVLVAVTSPLLTTHLVHLTILVAVIRKNMQQAQVQHCSSNKTKIWGIG